RPHGDELRAQTLPRDDRERRRAGGAGGRERDRVAGAGHTRGAGVLDGDRRLTRAGGDRNVVEDRTGDGAWPCGLNSSGGGRSKPGTTSTSPWSTRPASSLPTWAIPTSSPTGARRRSRSRPCRSPRTGCSSGSPSRLKSSRCAARRTQVSRRTDVAVPGIRTAVDGCGVVCYGLPLRQMALAYARRAIADFGSRVADSKGAGPIRNPQSAIVQSMLRHPELIAGAGRPCTDLMRAHPGRVLAKVGAEGVYCALLVRDGLGVALKVADGHGLAAALALAAVLEELGVRPRPASLGARPNVNTRGDTVGELRVNGGLEK